MNTQGRGKLRTRPGIRQLIPGWVIVGSGWLRLRGDDEQSLTRIVATSGAPAPSYVLGLCLISRRFPRSLLMFLDSIVTHAGLAHESLRSLHGHECRGPHDHPRSTRTRCRTRPNRRARRRPAVRPGCRHRRPSGTPRSPSRPDRPPHRRASPPGPRRAGPLPNPNTIIATMKTGNEPGRIKHRAAGPGTEATDNQHRPPPAPIGVSTGEHERDFRWRS